MPERLDSVEIATDRGKFVLPWSSRDQLLGKLSQAETGGEVCDAFKAVGASRPVELTLEQKGILLDAIDHWADQTDGGYEALPEGIYDLRNALNDDVLNAQGQGA